MSDGGFIAPPVLSQIPTAEKSAHSVIAVKILEIPAALSNQNAPPSLTGKILQHLSGNNAVITTHHGKITVKAPNIAKIPVGESIQLTINTTDTGTPTSNATLEINKNHVVQPRETATAVLTTTTYKPDITTNQLLHGQPKHLVVQTSTQDLQNLVPGTNNTTLTQLRVPQNQLILNTPHISEYTAKTADAAPLITTGKITPSPQQPNIQNTSAGHNYISSQVNLTHQPAQTKPVTLTSISNTQNSLAANINTQQPIVHSHTIQASPDNILQTNRPPPPPQIKPNITQIQVTQVREQSAPPPLTQSPVTTTNQPLRTIPDGRAGEVRATVIGFTKEQHFPVLRIDTHTTQYTSPQRQQHITLQSTVRDLSSGTKITLIPTSPPSASTAPTQSIAPITPPPPHSAFFLTPESWPVMAELEQSLHQIAPQIAQNFHAMIPTPSTPTQMNAASLFFLAAIRVGDMQGWIGEKAHNTLSNMGKTDVLNRAGNEFLTMMRMNNEPVSQEWKSLPLPIAWQDDIQKTVIHYRREDTSEHDESIQGGNKTRFIMDLNLSQIGDIQIDGLFSDAMNNNKSLDLIIRSEQHFSKAMQLQMKDLYTTAMEHSGLAGALSFQEKTEKWVNIAYDLRPEYEQNV